MKNELKEDIDFGTWPEHWTEVDLEKGPEWEAPAGFDKGLIDWKAVLEMADRREAAAKLVSPCPECGTIQTQLVDWRTDTLKMKCRHCKHKFEKKLK